MRITLSDISIGDVRDAKKILDHFAKISRRAVPVNTNTSFSTYDDADIVRFAEALIDWDGTNELEPEFRSKVEKFESETGIGVVPDMFTEDIFFYSILTKIEGIARSVTLRNYLKNLRMVTSRPAKGNSTFLLPLRKRSKRVSVSVYVKEHMIDANKILKDKYKDTLPAIYIASRDKLSVS